MKIDFYDESNKNLGYLNSLFIYFLGKIKEQLKLKNNISLEVDIVDNAQIHEINRTYRDVDRPTDVISFAFNDKIDGEVAIKNPKVNFIGAIYISYEKGKEQAEELQHSFNREMCFLFVHGCLHLLGYNHIDDKEAEIMYGIQRKIFEGETL